MHAEKRIKNKDGKTVGFIISGGIYSYQSVLDHIGEIDNLKVIGNNRIVSISGALASVTVSSLQQQMFNSNLISTSPLSTSYPTNTISDSIMRREYARDVQEKFETWFKSNRDPRRKNLILYVKGARQVGKTTEILYFASKHYKNIVYINLMADKKIRNRLSDMSMTATRPEEFTAFLRRVFDIQFINTQNTVLIIDEIQVSKDIFESLRSYKGSLDCDIIISGSYLGATIYGKFFQPMGDIDDVEVMPLSFKEFCCALGHDRYIKQAKIIGTSDETHKILWKDYEVYRQIGGYPDVIREYLLSKSIDACKGVLRKIRNTFITESTGYISDVQAQFPFDSLFEAMAESQLSEKRGRTIQTDLIVDYMKRSNKLVDPRNITKVLAWLHVSHITDTIAAYNVVLNHIARAQRSYFRDLGLLNIALEGVNPSKDSKEGLITETFAFNELNRFWVYFKLHGLALAFALYNDYELDFVVPYKEKQEEGYYFGVEVKTGNSSTKSLDEFIRKKFVNKGVIAGNTQGGVTKKGYLHIPIYMVGLGYPYN